MKGRGRADQFFSIENYCGKKYLHVNKDFGCICASLLRDLGWSGEGGECKGDGKGNSSENESG